MIRSRRCGVFEKVASSSRQVGILALLSALGAFGQGTSAVRSGSFEVGPFVGSSYGIDKFRVMAGGNVTYAFKNKYVLPYFEYSYFPELPRTLSTTIPGGGPITHPFTVPLSDIHGGVHVRLPIFKESHLVPYLVFGMGVVHTPARTENATFTSASGQPLTIALSVPAETDFAVNGGGGLRYYIGGTGKFGFRTEAKVYKPTSGAFSDKTIGKVEAGFFFQLH